MYTTNRSWGSETESDLQETQLFEFDEMELDEAESLFAAESDFESSDEWEMEEETDEYEISASSVPKPGSYYAIQYGKGGLLTTTGRAYGVPANAERLKLAQAINQDPRNRKFWVPPSNAYEKRYFPNGIISFNPMFTCGPDRMMAKVAELCAKRDVPCDVSLETPMACGYGVCLGCPVPTAESGYLYACVEGPCVDARRVDWSRADHAPKKGALGERGAP